MNKKTINFLFGIIYIFFLKPLNNMSVTIRPHYQLPKGDDRMVVGFTTTYAISAYHH